MPEPALTWTDTCATAPEPPPDDDTDTPWCRIEPVTVIGEVL